MSRSALRLALGLSLLAAACDRVPTRRFPLTGVVQELRASGEHVVAHDDIPGFMPAMTMPLRLKDAAEVRPGDRIEGTLVVRENESWVEGIQIRARGLPVTRADAAPPPADPGTLVPDFRLVDQDGKPVTFAAYRGRALLLTFIYTRCPIPEFCPRMMKSFKTVEAALASDPVLFERTRLLSVSFDPAFDTPDVLRSFGRAYGADPAQGSPRHWALATGTPEEIGRMAGFFGLDFWSDDGQITHSLCTAVVDADGKLVEVYRDNLWTPAEVVERLRRAAS